MYIYIIITFVFIVILFWSMRQDMDELFEINENLLDEIRKYRYNDSIEDASNLLNNNALIDKPNK